MCTCRKDPCDPCRCSSPITSDPIIRYRDRIREPNNTALLIALAANKNDGYVAPPVKGDKGDPGSPGRDGYDGARGEMGDIGLPGADGYRGADGKNAFTGFAYFYHDQSTGTTTIPASSGVSFDGTGNASGGIIRSGTSLTTFVLPAIGAYYISYNVPIVQAGQLEIWMNSGSGLTRVLHTTSTSPTTGDQVVGHTIVSTTVANSLIQITNPTGNAALTLSNPSGDLKSPITSQLTIVRVL